MKLKRRKKLCECGCREVVTTTRRFVYGHSDFGSAKNAPLCECGCSKIVSWNFGSHRWNKIIHGHNRTGKPAPTRGQKGQWHHTEEFKERMRNRIISKETRGKLSVINMGKKHSEETKRKLSVINTGKKLSEETKIKIAIAEMRSNNHVTRNGYCDVWMDRTYIDDLRKGYCENCGITNLMSLKVLSQQLAVHHKNGKKECSPDDTKTLCSSCHSKHHSKERRAAGGLR